MNSKIKLIKVERILVQEVPRFYDMMSGEPPNHRTVQRDDRRLPQLRGDWSPRRSSTIIPSSVHIKLIKHPISMVPMWKFPTSTMVSFRVCFFWAGEGIAKKNIPFHSGWGTLFQEDLDAKNPPRFRKYLGPFLGWLILGGCHYIIINLIIIKSCLVQSPIIYNCDIYMYFTSICDSILSSQVPSPEFFTVHASGSQFFPGQHPWRWSCSAGQ